MNRDECDWFLTRWGELMMARRGFLTECSVPLTSYRVTRAARSARLTSASAPETTCSLDLTSAGVSVTHAGVLVTAASGNLIDATLALIVSAGS
jgi:hypothetical protein